MMSPHEKESLLNMLQKLVYWLVAIPTTTSCMDCRFWSSGKCLKWQETIPKEVIENGCDSWVFNQNAPPF